MKRFLKKRWLGLPIGIIAVVLLVFLLAGGTLAATGAFRVFTSTTEVNVLEPLEVTEIQAPGEWWNWWEPEEPTQTDIEIYAGMDLGAAGYGGKYFIHNLIPSESVLGRPCVPPQSISVTVTVTEKTGQMEWYGLAIYYSNGWHGENTCNWANPIVESAAGSFYHTFTFDMGSVYYPTPLPSADILEDSNNIKFFVNGKVADGAGLTDPLKFIVTVDRGN